MTKTAETKVTLGNTEFTVKCEKNFVETLNDETMTTRRFTTIHTTVSFTFNGKKESGILQYVLNDPAGHFKGAFGYIEGTSAILSEASYKKLESAVKEAEKLASFEEYDNFVNGKINAENIEKKEEAERVIELAEKEIASKGKLMTRTEKANWIHNYNNVMNEGREGFVPEVICQEQYNNAVKILKELL